MSFGSIADVSFFSHVTYKCANCDRSTPILDPVYSFSQKRCRIGGIHVVV